MSTRRYLPKSAIGEARTGFAWTAFDPIEGRLDSDDPLGFQAAAQRLADRLLPGLTVRTVSLQYYAMVCAGLALIEGHQPTAGDRQRRDLFMVFEKLWALSRVSTGDDRGVLGVRGASRHLHSGSGERLDGRFVLLQRQPYLGALGSYSTSLEELNLKEAGALRLTDAGHRLAHLAWTTAAPNAWRKLQRSVWDSIRTKRDRLRHGTYGASHTRFATVGKAGSAIRAVLRDRLFDPNSQRGRAARLALPVTRHADIPDLAALKHLAAAGTDAELQRSACLALALEDLSTAAHFALERILGVAIANGLTVPIAAVPRSEPRWNEIEDRVRRAASHAAATFDGEEGFAEAHRAAVTLADLSGEALVTEFLRRHSEVMAGRRGRRWAAPEGDQVTALRLAPVPEQPAPIRHTYRFSAARDLAIQAGIR